MPFKEGTDEILVKPVPADPVEAACGSIEGDFSLTADLLVERHKDKKSESFGYPRPFRPAGSVPD